MPKQKPSIVNFEKLYMDIPFEQKEWAKENGLKFDGKAKCWYLPPGNDPLEFRDYWSYLENTYEDRAYLKKNGCRYNGKLKKWYVPLIEDETGDFQYDYDDFTKWWPETLKQYLFCDRYAVNKFITRSGQAEVYRAWDVEDDEVVAVKYFREDIDGISAATQKKAFQVEMEAVERLSPHPNIVTLKGWEFRSDTNRHCLVSEWVPIGLDALLGKPLEEMFRIAFELMRQAGLVLEWEEEKEEEAYIKELVAESLAEPHDAWLDDEVLLLGVLDGLAHAHSKGVYHRDIKFGNIMFDFDFENVKEGEDPKFVPKLCDFGIAKIFDDADLVGVKQSRHTLVDLYSPPWRPNFKSNPPDEHGRKEISYQNTWDVYAWGVLAVVTVADVVPSPTDDISKILAEDASPKIGPELTEILMRALADDPAERPQDIVEFRDQVVALTNDRKKQLNWKD
tara:strand:+ start:636 stop:1985 length:1350 start_codon:yes stop_codon:yes gene_type:complete